VEHLVQAGDTLLALALEYDLSTEELIAYNNLESDIIVEGQTLLIPPPTPTPGPTPTLEPGVPTATAAPFLLHTVRAGDTLSTIAEQYGVSMDAIRTANDIPAGDEAIQVNQVLTIPQSTPTPQPETVVSATSTPASGTSQYPAPAILYPPNGQVFSGPNALIPLQWASVGILDDLEYYQVELLPPGADEGDAVYAQMKSTLWRVPDELLPVDEPGEFVFWWRVQVVRQLSEEADSAYRAISPLLPPRSFGWTTE
jgi:LysM repeat protein